MTKLSETQRLELDLAHRADVRYRDARRNIEIEVRQEIDERTRQLREEREDALLAATRAGVPKAVVAKVAMGVVNTNSLYRALAAAEAREKDRVQGRYADNGDGTITVRLSGTELETACRATGWAVTEAQREGVDSAVFEVIDTEFTRAAVAVTEAAVGRRQHPVVAWGRAHSVEVAGGSIGVAA